jgi:hypothetical protein
MSIAIHIAFVLALATPFPPSLGSNINVEIGGVMSGPSRRYVDLNHRILLVGELQEDAQRGDGARIATSDLTVTRTVPLSETQVAQLRALAGVVLTKGAESRRLCRPDIDRIVVLNVANHHRQISGPVYCPSAQAEALISLIFNLSAAH